MNEQHFSNHYDLLQVTPECEPRIVEAAFRFFAKRYHPDNPETSDEDRFQEVLEAYRVLSDPEAREHYNSQYFKIVGRSKPAPKPDFESVIDETKALNDSEVQTRLLFLLYTQRRENPSDAGLGDWILQEQLGCGDDGFDFHVWYLRSKGFVDKNEEGKLAITVEGVDHVMNLERSRISEPIQIPTADKMSRQS